MPGGGGYGGGWQGVNQGWGSPMGFSPYGSSLLGMLGPLFGGYGGYGANGGYGGYGGGAQMRGVPAPSPTMAQSARGPDMQPPSAIPSGPSAGMPPVFDPNSARGPDMQTTAPMPLMPGETVSAPMAANADPWANSARGPMDVAAANPDPWANSARGPMGMLYY